MEVSDSATTLTLVALEHLLADIDPNRLNPNAVPGGGAGRGGGRGFRPGGVDEDEDEGDSRDDEEDEAKAMQVLKVLVWGEVWEEESRFTSQSARE
jgi:hypothetical protein